MPNNMYQGTISVEKRDDNEYDIDKGELIQRGSHEALLADESGKYRELWLAQAQHYAHE